MAENDSLLLEGELEAVMTTKRSNKSEVRSYNAGPLGRICKLVGFLDSGECLHDLSEISEQVRRTKRARYERDKGNAYNASRTVYISRETRIDELTLNLKDIAKLNDLARKRAAKEIGLSDARLLLDSIGPTIGSMQMGGRD